MNEVTKTNITFDNITKITFLLKTKDNRIAISSENIIYIYEYYNEYHCDLTIPLQHKVFRLSLLKENHLASVHQTIISILSIHKNTYQCIYQIENKFTTWIINFIPIELKSKNYIVSCAMNNSLVIWDGENYSNEPYKVLIDTDVGRYILQIYSFKDKLITISNNIIIWSLSSFQIINQIVQNFDSLCFPFIIPFDKERLIIGRKNTVMILNVEKAIIERSYSDKRLNEITFGILIDKDNMLSIRNNGLFNSLNIVNLKKKSHKSLKEMVDFNNNQVSHIKYNNKAYLVYNNTIIEIDK